MPAPARRLARLFQSAPRSRDRGDLLKYHGACGAYLFQSAPRSRDRGDSFAVWRPQQGTGFNPRPDHVTGATNRLTQSVSFYAVSIRAPIT